MYCTVQVNDTRLFLSQSIGVNICLATTNRGQKKDRDYSLTAVKDRGSGMIIQALFNN